MKTNINDDLVIVLAGEAGQGIQAIENIISSLLKKSGYNFFSTSEFMSRVRGGANSTEIRVNSNSHAGYVERIDILIPLHKESIPHLQKRITEKTIVIGEKEKIGYDKIIDIQFTNIAIEIGNAIFSNTVAAGFICGLLKIEQKECTDFIAEYFSQKNTEIISKNIEAIARGHAEGTKLSDININIKKSNTTEQQLLISGADSIALGALAGGCNYMCGYPMSPSTSVLEKMAGLSRKFDIIVEQVEDEIGVINMALGAWYAGARAMVTTSGGGFALMTEGISLCGMIESPMVLHLAQRPGPATGLPTRTEQGDLNLVLYAGHGDFPRIILAPGTLDDGFTLTQKAFYLADKYQIPVFILTDQFFVDSKYNTQHFDTNQLNINNHLIKTEKDYKRFCFSENGISPRGIPGYGTGNVCVDSDEHDESGHITEDHDIRIKMVAKRKEKLNIIKNEIIPPKLVGNKDYQILVICWGSTFNTILEAVTDINNKAIAVLHFSWVFPLPAETKKYLTQAKNIIIIENNSSAQLAQLIKLETGISIEKKILKYNGLPFSVEEIKIEIQKFI